MNNKDVITYYDKMSSTVEEQIEIRNKAKDFSQYDINFMKRVSNKNINLLDLGSGTGLLINSLVDDFKSITAVEKYENFSKFINKVSNLRIIHEDLLSLELSEESFDMISIFGVMNYFNKDEANVIYKKAHKFLKLNGTLIIKNQMGITEDVTVNGYSKELNTNYYSNYRYIKNEIKLLEEVGFSFIKDFDIYPSEYNRWNNTHFYAITAKKV